MNIDARGDTCPIPVIKARKAMKAIAGRAIAGQTLESHNIAGHEPLTVEVDNEIAAQNLEKMCGEMKKEMECSCSTEKIGEQHYKVIIEIGVNKDFAAESVKEAEPQVMQAAKVTQEMVVVISSDVMGSGNDELGAALLKAFVFALTEYENRPESILFYNGGAKLTTEGSPVLEDLQKLSAAGVSIMTCGACLNFYGLTERLQVGSITNMYSILDTMSCAAKIIKP